MDKQYVKDNLNKIISIEPIRTMRFREGVPLCFEDNIASIACWLNSKYQLMFIDSWAFNYELIISSNNIDIKRIKKIDKFELLEKYHGIKLIYHGMYNYDYYLSFVKNELLLNKPVITKFDAFWCPWDPGYQKVHNGHLCILVGMDEDNELLYFTDAYFSKKNMCVTFEQFSKSYGSIFVINLDNNHINCNWLELIKNRAIQNDNNLIKNMENFFSVLENINFNKYESDIVLKFYHNLKDLILQEAYEYTRFSNIIYELQNSNKNFSTVYDQFKTLYDNSMIIYSLLWKGIVSGKMNDLFGNILNRFKSLIELHNQIRTNIINICNNNLPIHISTTNKFNVKNVIVENNWSYLDLSICYNNKAIGNSASLECQANLTGLGAYILANDELQKSYLRNDETNFKLAPILDSNYDNISCNNQIINIDSDVNCTNISILGCAEFGRQDGEIVVCYFDGTQEKVIIRYEDFYIWDNGIPDYGGKVIWTGKAAEKNNNEIINLPGSAHLYYEKFKLCLGGKIKSLVLPDIPNIHIFAISINTEG